jgi:hypothetical protein
VWCTEAAVAEIIPAAKIKPGYPLRRAFRGGRTTALSAQHRTALVGKPLLLPSNQE